MFDNTQVTKNSYENNITFNSVAGTLVKSTKNSKFIRFHMNSGMADTFFNKQRPYIDKSYEKYSRDNVDIDVLQVMLCGDNQLLVEYVEKESKIADN